MKKIISIVFVAMLCLSTMAFAANDLVEKHCSSCHGTAQIYAKKGSTGYWDNVMKRMKRHGLQISADDEKAVMDYLYTLK